MILNRHEANIIIRDKNINFAVDFIRKGSRKS